MIFTFKSLQYIGTDDTNPEIETDKLNTERPQDETEGGEAIPTDTTEKEDAISKKRPKRVFSNFILLKH